MLWGRRGVSGSSCPVSGVPCLSPVTLAEGSPFGFIAFLSHATKKTLIIQPIKPGTKGVSFW